MSTVKSKAKAKAKAKPKKAASVAAKSKTTGSNQEAAVTKPRPVADKGFQQARRAAILLKHLSDPTRLQVILLLSEGEKHVGALCEHLNQSQPAVSHHLALLRHGSVIIPRRQGKNNYYGLTETGEILATVVKAITD